MCLENLIGIDRRLDTSRSGLYITDLPGMTIKIADAATDEETVSGYKLIEEKIDYAKQAVFARLRDHLKDKFNYKSVIESDVAGHYERDMRTVSTEAGKLKGIKARIDRYPYLTFNLESVTFKGVNSGDVSVYVYDLMSNKLLDTITVTAEAGVAVKKEAGKSYQTLKQRQALFICVDSTVQTYETTVGEYGGCVPCTYEHHNKYIYFTGAKIDSGLQKIEDNLQSNNGTYGLSIQYSVSCDLEPFLCSMGNLLGYAMLHKTGAEILREVKFSRRLNSIVFTDKAKNDEMLAYFESEYEASLEGIIHNMRLPKDICFECNSKIQKRVQIP